MFKKSIYLTLFLLFLTFSVAHSGVVEKTYYFSEPVIESTERGYDAVWMEGTASIASPGEPNLPVKGVQLLLPPGEAIESVEVVANDRVVLDGTYSIQPAQYSYPITPDTPDMEWVEPDAQIYNADQLFPAELVNQDHNTQFLCGHSIGLVTINPIQYDPANGKLYYYPSLNVRLITKPDDKSMESYQRFLRRTEKVNARLNKVVHNPEDILSYYGSVRNERDEETIDYLIVTKYLLVDDIFPLAEFKRQSGMTVKIIPTTDPDGTGVYDVYEGEDNQEKIRNCIIDHYENYGTQFVLLAGDGGSISAVPDRRLYGFVGNANPQQEDNLPADLYYGALDGNWNDDGDDKWGEINEADLYYEIEVGRAPTDQGYSMGLWLSKQINYQKYPKVDEVETALMVGENLDDQPNWGKDAKDAIIEGTYGCVGFPEEYEVNTLYDYDYWIDEGQPGIPPGGTYEGWDQEDLFPLLNENAHFVNHDGHSFEGMTMRVFTNDVTEENLTNDGINHTLNIIYDLGCDAGAFDGTCVTERWSTGISTGAVIYNTNSRFGWYNLYNFSNGSSWMLDREYFNAVWDEEIRTAGAVFNYSKEANASYFSGSSTMRWVYYCQNMFGDPSIDIWTYEPQEMLVEHPPVAVPGQTIITVDVTDTTGSYIPNARVCCSTIEDTTEVLAVEMTDSYGHAELTLSRPLVEGDTLLLYVSKHNREPYIAELAATFVAQIEGEITSGETGDPLAGLVKNEEFGIATTADTDGSYVLYVPTAGEYVIQAEYLGYVDYMSEPINISDGEVVTHDISLDVADNVGTIEGQVITSSGSPIQNAEVTLVEEVVLPTYTDEEGYYTFYPATPGEYQVQVIAEGYEPMFRSGTLEANGILTLDFLVSYTEKFEDTDGGFSGSGEWEWGISAGGDAGPEEANSGMKVWGTDLDGEYNSSSSYSLISQPYILDLTTTPSLTFYHWYSTKIASGLSDGGHVLISTDMGENWTLIEPVDGYPVDVVAGLQGEPGFAGESGGWYPVQFDLTDYADETVMFKLYFGSTAFTYPGWFIDDVTVAGATMYYTPPQELTADSDNYDVTLDWSTPETDLTVLGYNVYRHTTGEISFADPIAELDATTYTYTDNLPQEDTTYVYGVAAIYDEDESIPSTVDVQISVGIDDSENTIQAPKRYALSQNYPNPFNPVTTISFQIPESNHVSLKVYDVTGKLVRTLVDEKKEVGSYTVKWNGKDDRGNEVSSGLYFYRLQSEEFDKTHKCLLLK
jgi:hypothetical protein